MSRLTFNRLRKANSARAKRWHKGADEWTGADWSNAMCGEAGEAANNVKKLRRLETNIKYTNGATREKLIEKLGKELADTALYLDLVADYYDIDLAEAIIQKFNEVSDQHGFPERL